MGQRKPIKWIICAAVELQNQFDATEFNHELSYPFFSCFCWLLNWQFIFTLFACMCVCVCCVTE